MYYETKHDHGREAVTTLIKTALGILATVMVGQAFVYLLIQGLS